MASRNYLQGILLACAAGFFWGSMGVAAQYLLQRASFEVFDLVSIRLLGAGLLLLLYETLVSKRFDLKAVLKKRNAIDILIYGLGLVAAQATFFLSIEKSNAATASLMVTTVPLFVTAWTAYAEKRAITRREWLSLAMAAIGVGCIVTKGRLDTVDFSTAGVIWGIVSAGFVAFGTIQPKRVLKEIPVGVLVGAGMLAGGLLLIVASPPDFVRMQWRLDTAAVYFYDVQPATVEGDGTFEALVHGAPRGVVHGGLPVVAPVVLSEKAGRYVDRDDMSVRFIDIVDNGGESTCQRTVQPRAEKSVDHDVVFRQYGWREILDHLREFNPVHKKQAAFVGLAVGREMFRRVKQVSFYPIGFLCQQSGDGQRVSAVVALSGENDDAGLLRIASAKLVHELRGGPFDQVDRADRLMLDGVLVQRLDFICREYL